MKILFVLIAIVGGAGWWYFVGGRRLSESDVREFYVQQEQATLERSPGKLCDLLDDGFIGIQPGTAGGASRDKKQQCGDYRGMFAVFDRMGAQLGGQLQLDYSYKINSIEISPDRQSASVDANYSLDVAGSVMNIRSRSTDSLVQRFGKTLMVRSEGGAGLATVP
jgi:hypothetical protein